MSYSAVEAAKVLGISEKTIRRWVAQGRLIATHPQERGNRLAIPEGEVMRIKQERTHLEQQAQPIDPHETLYNDWRSALTARDMLDEYASDMVLSDLKKLTGRNPNAQNIADALNMTSMSMGRPPLDTLMVVHEWLHNYVSILEHGGGE